MWKAGSLVLLLLAIPCDGVGQQVAEPEAATPSVSVLAGSVMTGSVFGGWHAGIAVNQSLSNRIDLRGQGILASGDIRALSALVGLEVDVYRGLYATTGTGVHFDDGTPLSASVGVGMTVPVASRPIQLEMQYVSANGSGLYWGLRTPLTP